MTIVRQCTSLRPRPFVSARGPEPAVRGSAPGRLQWDEFRRGRAIERVPVADQLIGHATSRGQRGPLVRDLFGRCLGRVKPRIGRRNGGSLVNCRIN
jgi:hypothetical protein